jgi:hypothetical protein
MKKIKRRKPGTAAQAARPKSSYRLNPAVKAQAKEASRRIYRSQKGKDFELGGSTVLRSLEFVDAEAKTLPVTNQISSEVEVLPVLRLTNVAALLDVSYQTLWRWTSETQQLPMPVLVDNTTGREYHVYHLEEVRIIIGVIGEHLNDFKYYRKDHEATRDKLLSQIEALRARNFNSTKEGQPWHSKPRAGSPQQRRKPKQQRRT